MPNHFFTFSYEIFLSFVLLFSLFVSFLGQSQWNNNDTQMRSYCSQLSFLFGIILLSMLSLFVFTEIAYHASSGLQEFSFYGSDDFISTPFLLCSKLLTILITSCCLFFASVTIKHSKFTRVEYPFFYLSALLAMLLLIASNNLLYSYLALELLNFSIYLLLGGKVLSSLANEASQRYFVYSSYASAILLSGLSLVYGSLGSLNLSELSEILIAEHRNLLSPESLLLAVGILFLYGGILFKLAIFPFHFWVSEVYEGGPLPSVLFVATAPKIALVTLWIKITFGLAIHFTFFLPLLQFLSLVSIVSGTFGGLYEYRLKRFLAYSTITNMGFILLALSLHSLPGLIAGLLYLIVYLFTTVSFFALLLLFSLELNLVKESPNLESLELKHIFSLQNYQKHPAYLLAFTLVILSSAGIPPLGGFFIKFYVLQACLFSGAEPLAFSIFFLSVLGLAFYLRILRILYVTVKLSFTQLELKPSFLKLREHPSLVFFLLTALLFFLLGYGLLFSQPLLLAVTWIALHIYV